MSGDNRTNVTQSPQRRFEISSLSRMPSLTKTSFLSKIILDDTLDNVGNIPIPTLTLKVCEKRMRVGKQIEYFRSC